MPQEPGPGEVAEVYRRALARRGRVVELDLTPLDRTGVPVTSCSLLAGDRLTHHGNGYAATVGAAVLGGLGELAEGVLMAEAVAGLRRDARSGSRRALVAAEGADRVVDPRLLALPAGAAYDEDRPLEWVTTTRVRTGESVWVPLELVASDPTEVGVPGGRDLLVPPVTNGLGAGLGRARAVAHGIGEVLQRHTNALRFRALDRLSPEVDTDGVPDVVAGLLDRLRAAGVEAVLKHAVTELGVCSTYAVGVDDDPPARIMHSACGEAAHPDPATSAVKALLEYANSRARKAFCFGDREVTLALAPPAYRDHVRTAPDASPEVGAMLAWGDLPEARLRELVAPDRSRTVGWTDLGAPPAADLTDPQALLDHHLEALTGHDVLAAVHEADDVVAAKVLVTGLDVETLSHGRIGEGGVRTALDADLDLVRVQDGPSATHPARVHLTAEAEERLGGPAWFSPAVRDRLVGPLYPLYREPPRHTVEVV